MRKFLVVLVLLAFVTPALADDHFPAGFRGDPLSFQAEWDQFTNGTFGTGIYTDYENAVDDSDPATYLHTGFSTHLDFDPTPGWQLTPAQGGGFYNPLANATFAANVVNWIDYMPWKFMRIQVTYTDGGNGAPLITDIFGYAPITGGEPYFSEFMGAAPNVGYFYEEWSIFPNPDWEQIQFFLPQGTIIEQIVIDTISAPEPATMSLLALGGLAILRRRRS